MNFKNNPYFTVLEKIELLQRWIVVHSIVYYNLGQSVVTDSQFDHNCYQLVSLMGQHPRQSRLSRYACYFKDFDGSTGYDLPNKLSPEDAIKLSHDAERLCKRRIRRWLNVLKNTLDI